MFGLKRLLRFFTESDACLWIDVLLLKETPKAILVVFDGKEIWLPKAWILRVKCDKNTRVIRIKISEYHWATKF